MIIKGIVVAGYGVASGQSVNDDERGTISLQKPYFLARGLDLRQCFNGTINVDVAPLKLAAINGDYFFEQLKWHPDIAAENFSLVRCVLWLNDASYHGFIYYPHPETKPDHSQPKSVLEIIAPFIRELKYGDCVRLDIPSDKLMF